MRERTKQLNVRLTTEEMNRLKRYSRKCNLSASAYTRMLINGYVPKETPPAEYRQLMQKLCDIHDTLKIQKKTEDAQALQNMIVEMQKAFVLPEKKG